MIVDTPECLYLRTYHCSQTSTANLY